MPERVVFDCNVYFQALISPIGPAGACFAAAQQGQLQLFATEHIIQELIEVCSRPHLIDRFGFTPERLNRFALEIRRVAEVVIEVPQIFDYERDPDDEGRNGGRGAPGREASQRIDGAKDVCPQITP